MDTTLEFLNVEEMNFLEVPTLLLQWELSELAEDFAGEYNFHQVPTLSLVEFKRKFNILAKGIDYEALKALTVQDVDKLIPDSKFGIRVKFRQKLLEWREANVSKQKMCNYNILLIISLLCLGFQPTISRNAYSSEPNSVINRNTSSSQ